jgi:hypothetical protein
MNKEALSRRIYGMLFFYYALESECNIALIKWIQVFSLTQTL